MTTIFTASPWYSANSAGGHQGLIVSEATGANVAVSYEANDARLIAAAPELYESLEQTVASLEHWFVRHGDPEGVNSLMMKKARAALAKVKP